MKKNICVVLFLRVLLLLICFCSLFVPHVHAANYYFSANSGNDSRSESEAQNPKTPWKTLEKLNQVFASLHPGDSILLERDNTFTAPLIAKKSGTADAPIIIAAYGNGKDPVISGFFQLQHWTKLGDGIFQTNYPSSASRINMLVINHEPMALGRFPNADAPNKGWLTIRSATGKTQIIDPSLPAKPDFTGAQVVIRSGNYLIDVDSIAKHQDSILNIIPAPLATPPRKRFGYFIQDHPSTLDSYGEWCRDAANKKITVFFGNRSPENLDVRITFVDTLVYARGSANLKFIHLVFEGSNMLGMITNNSSVQLIDCAFLFQGMNGIVAYNTNSLLIDHCFFNYTQNDALYLAPNCPNTVVRNCTIKNTGSMAGMGKTGNLSYQAITIYGNNNLIEKNEIDTTGYVGIRFDGDDVTIRNNYINYHDFIKDDGGGIYTQTSNTKHINHGRFVVGNIVANGPGANEGTPSPDYVPAAGIYMDDNTDHVEIDSNTVFQHAMAGIYLHNSQDIVIRKNLLYDNACQLRVQHDPSATESKITNISVENNLLYARNYNQLMYDLFMEEDGVPKMGKIGENTYYRLVKDGDYFARLQDISRAGEGKRMVDLGEWKSKIPQEANAEIKGKQLRRFKTGNRKETMAATAEKNSGLRSTSSACSLQPAAGGASSVSAQARCTLLYPAGNIDAKKKYLLHFTIQGSTEGRDIYLTLQKTVSPYEMLDRERQFVKISGDKKENDFLFEPEKSGEKAAVIFEVPAGASFSISNLSFTETDAELTQTSDAVKLLYNHTKATKSFPLKDGVYTDVSGKEYRGEISLPPYGSVVLTKKSE